MDIFIKYKDIFFIIYWKTEFRRALQIGFDLCLSSHEQDIIRIKSVHNRSRNKYFLQKLKIGHKIFFWKWIGFLLSEAEAFEGCCITFNS